jgi:SAM-dependent methyltransferase
MEHGCGVGRVTPHLAAKVGHLVAADISLPHLDLARQAGAQAGAGNITYAQSRLPDFAIPDRLDFWFSRMVLQHSPPPVMAAILERVFAVLAPGGIAMFQLRTYGLGYSFEVKRYLASPPPEGGIEMHCLPLHAVFALAHAAGLRPLDVCSDTAAADSPAFVSHMVTLERPA